MFCTHCGKEIDEHKIEAKASSLGLAGSDPDAAVDAGTKVEYVCPRCGSVIHEDLEETDIKQLSRAAHAEIQRGHNSFSIGMGNVCIGVILLAIAVIFFRLSKKAANNFQLATDCVEFYVFCVLLALSVVLLVCGGTYVLIGVLRRRKYSALLKDIQNSTFVQ